MEQELIKKLEEQGAKIDAIYTSVEKTRKYFSVTLWITVLMVVVPLLVLGFVIPSFLDTYVQSLNG